MQKDMKKYTFYQIYLRSFQDTNGDGYGDLEGVIKRLPYLAKLGIDFIWLSPFYKSHQYDNGYDVDDYKSIDPLFGNFEIFDRLVSESKKLNIQIMLDMVFNHSSTHHKWFQKALDGDKKYQDYYIFKDNEGKVPTNWVSKFGGSAWKYVEKLDKYYLHLFHENQADLNWENPEVRKEFVDILKFWKAKGVTGFRFDVINLISKPTVYEDDFLGDGRRFYTDGPKVLEYMHMLHEEAGLDDCVTVGELSSTTIENSAKYTNLNNEAFDMGFNFHHLKVDYKDGNKWSIGQMNFKKFYELLNEWQVGFEKYNGWAAWFMNNHDQPRAISRFGNVKDFHYEVSTAIATLTHGLKGSPYIYQGEEIGMINPDFESIDMYKDYESLNYYKILIEEGMSNEEALYTIKQRSRDNGRLPIRWDDSENGGFTEGNPWILLNPEKNINYNDAVANEKSIFYFYKDLVSIRKSNMSLSHGDYELIHYDDNIYIFNRNYKGDKITILVNLTEEKIILNDDIKEMISDGDVLINNYNDFDFDTVNEYQSMIIKY